jgi:CCR4-NOT transcription complex subunit 7/8
MNNPYQVQQNHFQSHSASHQQHAGLPPPHLGANSFGGAGSAAASPFAMAGNLNNGFDQALLDGSAHPGQMAHLGFGRGGPVQGHQTFNGLNPLENKDDARIRNVWKHNLKDEMETLRALVDKYPYIAMVGHAVRFSALCMC